MTPASPALLAGRPYGALKMWPADPRSAGMARKLLAAFLVECGLARLVNSAEVVVSELVTNAVTHAYPPRGHVIATRFGLLPHGVRIEVHDASEKKPEHRAAAPEDVSGRGLDLVDEFTLGRWGVSDRDGPGKCVWAHIEDADVAPEPPYGPEPRKVPGPPPREPAPMAADMLTGARLLGLPRAELISIMLDVMTGAHLLRARFAQLRYDVRIESDPRNMTEEEVSALLRSLADKLTTARRESADGSVDIVLAVLK